MLSKTASTSIKIIISLFVVCIHANLEVVQSDGDGGFLFTVPKSVRSGKREMGCLSLHGSRANSKADVSVNVESIGLQKNVALTKKSFDAENVGCFEIRIPDTTDTKAKLHLQVKFADELNYSVNSLDTVNIIQNHGVTFIQTDKEIYKPGDRVKIRILILSNELTIPKNLTIPTVKIRNPIQIAIGQWENLTAELGLVQLEHQLSQETMLGTWLIELPGNGNVFKTFEVKEYVLPRFEIIIENSETYHIEATVFNFTVCAKYSYGLGVKGTAHLRILVDNFPVNQLKELQKGCAHFTVNRSELPIRQYITLGLQLIASVTEQGTGQMISTSKDVKLSNEKYVLQFVGMPSHFQHGIPYKGQVQVTESFQQIRNKTLKICLNYGIEVSWNLTTQHCSHFEIDDKNSTEFIILPFDKSITEIQLSAQIEENETEVLALQTQNFIYHSVSQWYSPSNSFIHLTYESTNTPIKCKAWQPFTILYTLNDTVTNGSKHSPIEFNYLIKSKGNIIKFGKVTHTPCSSTPFDINEYKNVIGNTTNLKPILPIDKFILTVKIHQKMFSEGQLLVYYVRTDGEVVGTSINFQVENCFANKVETSWSENQNYPGESTNFKIKAAAGSLCAISATDKKTLFLSPTVNLNADSLIKYVKKEYFYDAETSSKCKKDYNMNNDYSNIPFWDLRRRKRFYADFSTLYDTLQVFNDNELLVMTDLKILSRPCFFADELYSRGEPRVSNGMVYFSPESYQTQASDMGATVRSYFPETWLWELVPIGRTGEIQLKKELPHSITQWISNVFCISPSAGIGVSQTTNITTFKPFFIDVIAPYSIKRNEVSHLKVVVHNYLNHSLPVGITLGISKNIRSAGSPEESFVTVCIGANDAVTNTFRVTATALGRQNFTITAEVDSAYPGECGPEVLLNRKDVIIKSILIQAEGFPFERSRSNFVCAKNFTNETKEEMKKEEIIWNVEVPFESIKNSSRLKLLLDADLLELTIENLGSLLNIPAGCGEQIMATLAPNFYVLRYLNETGSLTPQIQKKTLNNIRIGYERILQYRHRDGSFSAFGEKHGSGSMFLTAFVLRTLSQVSNHVYIDKNIITKSATWILEKQLENGCFLETSYAFQSGMVPETGSENNVALTAYVLISLIESGLPIQKKVIDNAKYCLRGYSSTDKYTISMISYALALVKWEDEALRSLERLLEIGTRKNGLLSWEDPESLSKSLEITSYMILSLVSMNDSEHLGFAHEAVRWLLTKRNTNGGFISTQDTVVALDALTKFAMVAKKENTNVTVSVTTGGKLFHFRMKNKAKLKTKQISLTKFSNFIKFRIEGTGCILIQTLLRYNMPQIISSEALKLAVSVNSVSTIDKCAVAQLSPCFSYLILNKQINMAVLELTLPSGYKADRTSLFKLTENSSSTRVERFEEIENKVVLYFTKVANEKICVPFLINEQSLIKNRTEAIARLYDYYNPQISASTSYQLPNCSSVLIDPIK